MHLTTTGKGCKIVIIGDGVFGLTATYPLASEEYDNILVLDRHMPPVIGALINPWVSRLISSYG